MVADCIIFNYNAYQNTCCNKCLSFKIILNALYILCFKKHKTNVRYEMDITFHWLQKKISVTPDEHKIPVRGNSIKYHNTEGMIVW
jgi:hypothetical protein